MSIALFEVPYIVSIRLNCWRIGRKWKHSRIVGEAWELLAPVSNNARHLTPFTSNVTMGYTNHFLSTLVAVISWSRDVGLSHIDVWCLRLQIWQPEQHLLSAARCRLPEKLKHSCFRPSCYNCNKIFTIHSSLFSCVVISFATKFFSRSQNLTPGFPALAIRFISFQLFKAFINCGKFHSFQSISPLTRSAFTPLSLSNTLLAFPVTSSNLPSVSKHCTFYTSFEDKLRLCSCYDRQLRDVLDLRIHDLTSFLMFAEEDILCPLMALCCERQSVYLRSNLWIYQLF